MEGLTVEAVNAYFTPLDYFFYLSTIVVGWVVWLQWKWARTCKNNILVLVQRAKGSGDWELAPVTSNSITLPRNPDDKDSASTQLWAINELSTIDVLYPGVGFIPKFLQKQIRMVVVSEDSWEPVTNRSKDRELVSSPAFLGNLMNEKITEAAVAVNKEIMDTFKKLGRILNPTHFYVSIMIVLAMLIFLIVKIIPILEAVEALSEALGL